MAWWVLTYLENTRAWTSLFTQAETNRPDHLFMSWSHYKPSRTHVYRTVRGTTIFCGYNYTWDTPNVVEQNDPGDTLAHTFGPVSLLPADHVWYYLWSIAGPYGQPCQGPLIHVLPWETTMPSCRLTNSTFVAIPLPGFTTLDFDTERWDDGGFHDPAVPSVLKAPIPGLYEVGGCVSFDTTVASGVALAIQFNSGLYIIIHNHAIGANGWEGTKLSLHTLWPFATDDFVELRVRQLGDAGAIIIKESLYSPEFWINYVGPNPT